LELPARIYKDMKVSMKFVFILLCSVALCYAQSEVALAPAGSAPTVNSSTGASPAENPKTDAGSIKQQAPEASAPAASSAPTTSAQTAATQTTPAPGATPVTVLDLPPARKPGSEAKAAAGSKPAEAGGKTKAEAQPYVIGALDVLSVKVWGQQNLTSMYAVAADGTISMPLIGDLTADGLTREQLRDAISRKLAECCFNNDPEVDVQVEKINSKRYFVYGGVGRAGEYPLIRPTTIMDALSEVGGFRDFANTKKIRIQRTLPSGQTTELKFNYKEVSNGKNMEQNILILNGDRIFVPE
jgi:polysaccharide export outer membrane protein